MDPTPPTAEITCGVRHCGSHSSLVLLDALDSLMA
jgi:hypothetical protein